jgi:hypothetical protein
VRKTEQRKTLANSFLSKSISPRILREEFETLAFQNLGAGPHSGLQSDFVDDPGGDNL